MAINLFEGIGHRQDKIGIVMNALNSIYASGFLSNLKYLVDETGIGLDYAGCFFPEDDDDFEGIRCYCLDDEAIVSKEEFFSLLKQACKRYIELHPEKREELEQIISQSTLV